MSTTRQIISGSLRPNINTNLGDDYYAPEFRQLQDAVEVYVPHYKMDFPAYEFNYKVKYYRKLIDNNVIETLNAAFHECFNASAPRIAFKLMQMRRTIRGNVEELDKMIRQNGYELDQLLADNVNFKDAVNRKECAFIFNYLQLSLIRLFLEFQFHYSDQIDDSKKMSCEDFYLQVLGVRPPTPPIIAEIIRETPPPKQKKLGGRAVGKKGFWLGSRDDTLSVLVPGEYPWVKTTTGLVCHLGTGQFKPYLRSMSNMTEEEREELSHYENSVQITDFFYARHIDCRFLIEKGIALEAPEDMYKIE